MERLAVIIVNYGTPKLAIACINSLIGARASFAALRVIVVDGGSNDGSAEMITQEIVAQGHQDWVELMPLPINGGFAFANNRALLKLAEDGVLPEFVALINPDARVTTGAIEALADTLRIRPRAAAVGALLIHEDGRAQGSAFHFPTLTGEFCRGARTGLIDRLLCQPPRRIDTQTATEVPWVTGAGVMLRTEALQSVGLFDEGFFLYFEETELMWRLRRAGWQIWHEPTARVIHAGGAATRIRDPDTGRALPKRIPRYWYESRRRYFALVGGRPYALAAGLFWLTGHALWRLRRAMSRTPEDGPISPAHDMIAYGWWLSRADSLAAVRRLGSPVSSTPAWMQAAA